MKRRVFIFILAVLLWFSTTSENLFAQTVHMSYPGLTGESCPLWIAKDLGLFKQNGVDAELVYMEGGRLSIQSLLAGSTQFMAGDAVSAFSAVAGGADIVLLASAKNVLPYIFAVSKDIRRPQDLKGKIIATSQVGGRAGEIARMAIRNMGLDPEKDVTYLAVGGTMSRLAALSTGKVQAAPISHVVAPVAEERGLKILKIDPIPFIVDALWATRKIADENPKLIQDVVRSYVQAIATVVNDREKSLGAMRKYMRTSDSRVIQNAYETYKAELDRVPIPSDKAIQNTLELSQRVAPKLVTIDIKRHLYFDPVRRLATNGFIDALYNK
jgi:ABC-type nitrate/sulfonate/bicarbonate transport system substrate-binding protein